VLAEHVEYPYPPLQVQRREESDFQLIVVGAVHVGRCPLAPKMGGRGKVYVGSSSGHPQRICSVFVRDDEDGDLRQFNFQQLNRKVQDGCIIVFRMMSRMFIDEPYYLCNYVELELWGEPDVLVSTRCIQNL
jgi:hypothetical protein